MIAMTFHGRMLHAQHAKREAANRGLSRGNQGMRPLTKSERAAIDPPAGSWDRLLAETKIKWHGARTDAIETYRFAYHDIRGDSLYLTL
jgi:hypothetical protein